MDDDVANVFIFIKQPGTFWCENEENIRGGILLHYFSHRGSLLCPLVVDIIQEVARYQFELDIVMTQLTTQGYNGAECSSWRITTFDLTQFWKLSSATSCDHSIEQVQYNHHIDFDAMGSQNQCPFLAMQAKRKSLLVTKCTDSYPNNEEKRKELPSGLSLPQLQTIFPFHVLVDNEFKINQIGCKMASLLDIDRMEDSDLLGMHVGNILDISSPVIVKNWCWKEFNKFLDQKFIVNLNYSRCGNSVSNSSDCTGVFSVSMIEMEFGYVMFVLSPEAKDVTELNNMRIKLADLPLHGHQRDSILLGEYITQEVNKAYELEILSKKFENEKNLSNNLLYNLFTRDVADDLRQGRPVQAQLYENVTLFFSDIEGFTAICDKVDPWAVIDMLNQLYSVMDYLASHFQLYKAETIGDAYICCSGLPTQDKYHAENIANFAIAVTECVKHIKSPSDGSPIKLRIGIHTGKCTAGVVGTLAPKFCLFGDMVNFTARHEQSSIAGRIQCSNDLFHRLLNQSPTQFVLNYRGKVEMKGKGQVDTYWLEKGTDTNRSINDSVLKMLSSEVSDLLTTKQWKVSRYFSETTNQIEPNLPWDSIALNDDQTATTVMSDLSDADESDHIMALPGNTVDHKEVELNVDKIINDLDVNMSSYLESLCIDQMDSDGVIISKLCDVILPLFRSLFGKNPNNDLEQLEKELCSFVNHVTRIGGRVHLSFAVATTINNTLEHVNLSTCLDTSPLYRFVLIFISIIKSCIGAEEETINSLNENSDVLYFSKCLNILREEYTDLYDEITWSFPHFLQALYELLNSTECLEGTIDKTSQIQVGFVDKIHNINAKNLRGVRRLHSRSVVVMSLILGLSSAVCQERIVYI